MACSIDPQEFEDLIPNENDDICTKFLKFKQFSEKFVEWYSCFFDENGNLSDDIVDDICELDCVGGSTTSSGGTSAPIDETIFEAAEGEQTYIVPAGVTSIFMRGWGAGGGGGGGANCPLCPVGSDIMAGGGGGGGGYAAGRVSVTPGEPLTIQVSLGGSGGSVNTSGVDGGQSYVKRGSTFLIISNGGRGGVAGTAVYGSYGGNGGSGGTGSAIVTATDRETDTGDSGTNGTLGQAAGASGAGGPGGNCGDAGGTGGAAGTDGGLPGGGGGGGNTGASGSGGDGGNAQISFT